MNLSPQDRKAVLELIAEKAVAEMKAEAGNTMLDLVLIPMSVAEKMMAMNARTIKARIPWVDLAPNRTAVKLSDVKAFIEKQTRQPR